VDGRVPRPAVKVLNATGGNVTVLTVNQGESLKFTPTGSVDDMITVGDGLGIIDTYSWKLGNGTPTAIAASATDKNATFEFTSAGVTKVVLNVTDVVGNWKNMTISVKVMDKTAPAVNLLKTLNATWGVTLIERSAIYFDASSTTDNVDNISALNFNWTFGDNSAKKGGIGLTNVSHNYSSYGQYDITLNVTDTSGNNLSMTRTIYVGMGDRPNVYPDLISFDPKTFEEGVSGKITVNITNKGTKIANDVTIEIWWYSGTIAQKRIGNISMIYDANGTQISSQSLAAGQTGHASIDWTPDAKGNYSIRAIVNSTDQPSSNWGSGTIDVKEASWKGIAVPVFIVILVIAIPVIMIARRRIGSMGSMRRPKKEKEEKVKEKKEEK